MSRALDFVALVVIVFLAFIVQFAGAAMLEPLDDQFQDDDAISDENKGALGGMFTAATFWVPLICQLGAVAIVGWREFRRRRDTVVSQAPL